MTELVSLTINGQKLSVPKGTLLVEAAKQVSVDVPVFCYHKKLKPVGACRMCLVEIEKNPRLQTACTTPAAEGMVVSSVSPNAIAGQNAVIELLLANHPLDCPICDKGGECPLQDNTFQYGLGTSRMTLEKRHKDKAFPLSEKIVLDKERCIMCYRCTRFQAEIPGDHALVALERGGESEIGTLDGEPFESPFSGNTIELCPVGALTSRYYRFRARPWDLTRTASVCSGCSVGCNVSLQARDGALLRVLSRENPTIDDGWLCDAGRFETLPPLTSQAHCDVPPESRRPVQPLVRRDGVLAPATLDAALARAAELLREAPGPSGAVILAAATTTNEAAALLQRHVRPLLPEARIACDAGTHTPWPVQGRIANLRACTKVVNVGIDPWTELPVLALWQRKPLERGGTIVAVGPHNGLSRDTAAWLVPGPGGLAKTLDELLHALEGKPAGEAATAAAKALDKPGPAAVLLGSDPARDGRVLDLCQRLAARLGANGETGLVGAPAPGANARGIQQEAPELVKVPPPATVSGAAVLTLGHVATGVAAGSKRIVASWTRVEDTPDVEVVLPLAHPYEQQGTWINLDGQTQRLARGGGSVKQAFADHVLLAKLVEALGGRPLLALETVAAPSAEGASAAALSER
jgi:NADH-quinone oxidoreductase subunit G